MPRYIPESRVCPHGRRVLAALCGQIILTAAFFICFSFSSHAVTQSYDLNTAELSVWTGSPVDRLGKDSVLYSSGAGSAYTDISADGFTSFMLYCDAGNYSGKGRGEIRADCYNSAGEIIRSYTGAAVPDDGSFRRYNVGNAALFAGFPPDTAFLRITLSSDGGRGPFYKALSLTLSSENAYDESVSEWNVSGKTGLVEVDVTPVQYWTLVAVVAGVALIMLGVRKYLDRIKTTHNRL